MWVGPKREGGWGATNKQTIGRRKYGWGGGQRPWGLVGAWRGADLKGSRTGDRVLAVLSVDAVVSVCLCQLCPRVSILIYFRDPLLSPNAFPRSPCPLKTDASPLFGLHERNRPTSSSFLERTCVRGKTGALSFLRASSRCRGGLHQAPHEPGPPWRTAAAWMDGW